MSDIITPPLVPGQIGELLPKGTRVDVFESIFWVFLVLGTLVGVVVIGYMLYNAYKYRDDGSEPEGEDRPTLGELPKGGGKGRKLFLSFGISAIIVISLVVWTYAMLLYVESGTQAQAQAQDQATTGATDEEVAAQEQAEPLTIRIEGFQFGWRFIYPNGHETTTMYIPEDRRIHIRATATDVFHNFGIPEFRVKTDAIPGHYTETWFVAEDTGTYTAKCYELCGTGHSAMVANVEVMTSSEFQEWYAETDGGQDEQNETDGGQNETDSSEGRSNDQSHATATRVEVTP